MTKLRTLSAVVLLSAAVASPVFAHSTHHSRIHVRHFRGAYNQSNAPYAVPSSQSERALEDFQFDRSFPGGEDPDLNPPS
jgi:hypothetical protein